jgi:RNA polymerase sigma-70 factor (ECF subfamily)
MGNVVELAGWRERWNRSLLQFLGRRIRSSIDIEDLAQETYLRLLRAPDLREVRNPQAYLLRVASHVVREWRQANATTDPLPNAETLLIDECLPELNIDAMRAQQRLDETLARMSPAMRAVVLLRLREEYPCKRIAQELELTSRQVRRYLERGYDSLREALEG